LKVEKRSTIISPMGGLTSIEKIRKKTGKSWKVMITMMIVLERRQVFIWGKTRKTTKCDLIA